MTDAPLRATFSPAPDVYLNPGSPDMIAPGRITTADWANSGSTGLEFQLVGGDTSEKELPGAYFQEGDLKRFGHWEWFGVGSYAQPNDTQEIVVSVHQGGVEGALLAFFTFSGIPLFVGTATIRVELTMDVSGVRGGTDGQTWQCRLVIHKSQSLIVLDATKFGFSQLDSAVEQYVAPTIKKTATLVGDVLTMRSFVGGWAKE